MNWLTRLHILPRAERRFGFLRASVLGAAIAAGVLAIVALGFGEKAFPEALTAVIGVPAVVVWWVVRRWNRRAVGLGAPTFWPASGASLRKAAFPVAAGFTLLVLIWAVAHWSGARAWESVQTQLRQRGEPLTFAELLGPPVPADQNFAEIPLLRGLFDYQLTRDARGRPTYRWMGNEVNRTIQNRIALPPATLNARSNTNATRSLRRTGVDLAAMAESFRTKTNFIGLQGETPKVRVTYGLPIPPAELDAARAVLFAMEGRREVMSELVEGLRRPQYRFALRHENGALTVVPYLGWMKAISGLFQLRATARLEAGDTAGAMDDVRAIFAVQDRMREETTLIGHFVRLAISSMGMTAVWHGITHHQWTEAQLTQFQRRFEAVTERDVAVRALRSERLLGCQTLELLINGDLTPGDLEMAGAGSLLGAALPSFRLRRAQATYARVLDQVVSQLQTGRPDRTFASQGIDSERILAREVPPVGFMRVPSITRMMMPSFGDVTGRFDRALVTSRLAACACALERYRLAEGRYPQALAELVPRFVAAMPMDPEDGEPLRYRLEADGTFTLYSVGSNQRDHGGRSGNEPELLDWVWPPAQATSDQRLF
jgi:hypothetical protein